MSVPDEALDVALTAFADTIGALGSSHRDGISAALAAAAPFIAAPFEAELRKARGTIATLMKLAELSSKVGDLEKAQAWDEGWDALADFDHRQAGPYPTNPYRSNRPRSVNSGHPDDDRPL